MQIHNYMKVGYAVFSKAMCKVCMTNIARHIIKVTIVKQQGDYQKDDWYHFECLKHLPDEVKKLRPADIDGFLTLKYEDQQIFIKRFEDLKLISSPRGDNKKKKQNFHTIYLDTDQQSKKIKNNNSQQSQERDTNDIFIMGDKYTHIFDNFRQSLKSIGQFLLQEEEQVISGQDSPILMSRQKDMIGYNQE